MATQLLAVDAVQISSGACTIDITPPTFAGIAGLTVTPEYMEASWLAASDATNPIRYEVFVQPDSDDDIFNSIYINQVVYGLSARIFIESVSLLPLQKGRTYYVAVRARDAVNNTETNIVTLNEISLGVGLDALGSYVNLGSGGIDMSIQANQFNMEVQVNETSMEIQSEEEII